MCRESVQVLHRTCKPAASWRFFCTSKRFPFGGWPINVGPARGSSVGILQRMPKPGSFASRSCTPGEHLRARPKHIHLQGGTCLRLFFNYEITNSMQPFAALPPDLNSQLFPYHAAPLEKGRAKGAGWIDGS